MMLLILSITSIIVISLASKKSLLPNDALLDPCLKKTETFTNLPNNIKAPLHLHRAILEVINRYPELQKDDISFVYKTTSTTMATRPAINLNILSKKNRGYLISINKEEVSNKTTFDFDSLKYEFQVAWIAHEFGHIIDYKSRNIFSLIGMGINYFLKNDFKKKTEAFAHKSAIYHGFGEETYQSFVYVYSIKLENIPKNYKTGRENYLTPIQVRRMVTEYNELLKNCRN